MARIRTIKPEFFHSLTLAECSTRARLLFVGLWTHCDDDGRAVDEPRIIKGALFPLDEDITAREVDRDLASLEGVGAIRRYEVEGKRYLVICSWHHQKIDRPSKSRYPAPPDPPEPDSSKDRRGLDEDSTSLSSTRDQVPGNGEQGSRRARDESTPVPLALVGVEAPAKLTREKNPIWDALAQELGQAATKTERNIRGKTCRELEGAGATPAEVTDRCREYRTRYPDAALTDSALCKHWSALGTRTTAPTGKRLSGNSQAFLNMLAAAEAADAADSLGTRDYIDVQPIGELA